MSTSPESRVDFVVRKLREARPKVWPLISRAAGVPESTLRKIAYRETRNPYSSTLDALHEYFSQQHSGAPTPDRRRTPSQLKRETRPPVMRGSQKAEK